MWTAFFGACLLVTAKAEARLKTSNRFIPCSGTRNQEVKERATRCAPAMADPGSGCFRRALSRHGPQMGPWAGAAAVHCSSNRIQRGLLRAAGRPRRRHAEPNTQGVAPPRGFPRARAGAPVYLTDGCRRIWPGVPQKSAGAAPRQAAGGESRGGRGEVFTGRPRLRGAVRRGGAETLRRAVARGARRAAAAARSAASDAPWLG